MLSRIPHRGQVALNVEAFWLFVFFYGQLGWGESLSGRLLLVEAGKIVGRLFLGGDVFGLEPK